jgi:hypothetical protein
MDFSKRAATCAAGLLLAAGQAAAEENILRFRTPNESSVIRSDRDSASEQPLLTVRFLSPASPVVTPLRPAPVGLEAPAAPDAPDLHEMPATDGYDDGSGYGDEFGGYSYGPQSPLCDPWEGYGSEKARRNERVCRFFAWLETPGSLMDLFGFFKRRHCSTGCCQTSVASLPSAVAPATEANGAPDTGTPRNAVPQNKGLPRNQIPQSSSGRPATSIAHQRNVREDRR